MKTITLVRRGVKRIEGNPNYRLDLEVTASQSISREVFVKQRLTRFDGALDDVFVAVASPANLEDIDPRSPKAGTTYFRSSTVSMVSTDSTFLDTTFNTILAEIQLLCDQAEVLTEIEVDGVYTITSNSVSIDMANLHTHYRLPLTAAPCGLNTTEVGEDEVTRHVIASVDEDLPGWLPSEDGPAGYHFKYNIAQDSSLALVWPVKAEYLQYAHIEKNGVTIPDLLVNEDGIYWKSNLYGQVPWPRTYVNPGQPWTSSGDAVTLVFDTLN